MLDNLLFAFLFFFLFLSHFPRRCDQVKLIDARQHKRWQEVGVFAVIGAVLSVESIGDWQKAEDLDIGRQSLIVELVPQIFQVLVLVAVFGLCSAILFGHCSDRLLVH